MDIVLVYLIGVVMCLKFWNLDSVIHLNFTIISYHNDVILYAFPFFWSIYAFGIQGFICLSFTPNNQVFLLLCIHPIKIGNSLRYM